MSLGIEELAKKWLFYNYQYTDIVEILPFQSSHGLVVYFYHTRTGEDFDWFLTVPMVQELLDGRKPKNVKNKYKPIFHQTQFNVGGATGKSSFTNQIDRGKPWLDTKSWVAKHHKAHRDRKVSKEDKKFIFDRDANHCLKCWSKDSLTIDHVIPISKNGKNDRSNYQTLCFSCNTRKGSDDTDYRK